MAAKEEVVNEIHVLLAKYFKDMLEAEEAKEFMIPAAILKTMTGFVKDNNVTCQEEGSSLETLKEHLEKKRATVTALPFVAEM